MAQWEYRTETATMWPDPSTPDDEPGLSADELSDIDTEGWELFAALPIGGHGAAGEMVGTA